MSKNKIKGLQLESPFQIEVNFKKLIELMTERADIQDELSDRIRAFLPFFDQSPKLTTGMRTLEELEENKEMIGYILDVIFPYPLKDNEIKAVSAPFSDVHLKTSNRFQKILDEAGPDYVPSIRNLDKNNLYIVSCCMILAMYYKQPVNFKRPFLYDIPDASGKMKHYRLALNGDFFDILKTDQSKEITAEDVAVLIDNFENVEVWKEKIPPGSFILRGFGISTLIDVTMDEALSAIKTAMLTDGDNRYIEFKSNLEKIFDIGELHVGISLYSEDQGELRPLVGGTFPSVLSIDGKVNRNDLFCHSVAKRIFGNKKHSAISDGAKYEKRVGENFMTKNMKNMGIKSWIIEPILSDDKVVGLLTVASEKNLALNSINAQKLKDISPILTLVLRKELENFENQLDLIIQNECTSIHQTVQWKFKEEAERYLTINQSSENATFKELSFEDVYPLYGQLDIRGSSKARNEGIEADLKAQLLAAQDVLNVVAQIDPLTIYDELNYRIDHFIQGLEKGLGAGSEQEILDFLSYNLYPAFNHMGDKNDRVKSAIKEYRDLLDPSLNMVYNKRKDYDDTVAMINKKLALYLDRCENNAQQMFPHFFERYNTDGVEYNIYIGQSLTKERTFDKLYLANLKLWQLKTQCELENVFEELRPELKTDLRVASLILAYSNPLSIKFRMDEKHFDVDGAYNTRYEIVKKRIDKANIKGTEERLTQPGKIAIVYTQQAERNEYEKYIQYLAAIGYVEAEIEDVDLQDLQGISGLKAMRLQVIFHDYKNENSLEGTKSAMQTLA